MAEEQKSWWQKILGWFTGWFKENKDIAAKVAKIAVQAAIEALSHHITNRNKESARQAAVKYARDNYPDEFAKYEIEIKNEINRWLGQEVAKNEKILKRNSA